MSNQSINMNCSITSQTSCSFLPGDFARCRLPFRLTARSLRYSVRLVFRNKKSHLITLSDFQIFIEPIFRLEQIRSVADFLSAPPRRLHSLPLASLLALPPFLVGAHSGSWFKNL